MRRKFFIYSEQMIPDLKRKIFSIIHVYFFLQNDFGVDFASIFEIYVRLK